MKISETNKRYMATNIRNAIILVVVLIVAIPYGISSYKRSLLPIINEKDIKEPALYTKIGSVYMKISQTSIGNTFPLYSYDKGKPEQKIRQNAFIYLDNEEVDEKYSLKNKLTYFSVTSKIKNESNNLIDLDLNEFYLVLNGVSLDKTPENQMRYAYIDKTDEVIPVEDFKLSIQPQSEVLLTCVFVVDKDKIESPFYYYYRVKCSNKIAYYST